MKTLRIGNHIVGEQQPTFIIGEIGINHNGDIDTAIDLIKMAKRCGCQAVKFQKRTPETCVPYAMREQPRDTPWGQMSYLEYKKKIELSIDDYSAIDYHCDKMDMLWSASCWDREALGDLKPFSPPFLKIPSACVTDYDLVRAYGQLKTDVPIIMSTGMSTHAEIQAALAWLPKDRTILMHCNSSYPAANEELNLLCISTLRKRYDTLVGYSGHERGVTTSCVAIALGACIIERHITLDRTDFGTDQAASLEAPGLSKLCRDIRVIEEAIGDGIKRVYDSEDAVRQKLRRIL